MAMLRNITMPPPAPAAELASPQALPELECKRLPNPSIKPSLVLNVSREIRIDSGLTESTRNVLGNGKLRALIMNTQMISISVIGMNCLHVIHTIRREEPRGDNRDQALPVSNGESHGVSYQINAILDLTGK